MLNNSLRKQSCFELIINEIYIYIYIYIYINVFKNVAISNQLLNNILTTWIQSKKLRVHYLPLLIFFTFSSFLPKTTKWIAQYAPQCHLFYDRRGTRYADHATKGLEPLSRCSRSLRARTKIKIMTNQPISSPSTIAPLFLLLLCFLARYASYSYSNVCF